MIIGGLVLLRPGHFFFDFVDLRLYRRRHGRLLLMCYKLSGYDGAVFSACSSRAESRVSNEDTIVVVFRVDDHKFLRETLIDFRRTSPSSLYE